MGGTFFGRDDEEAARRLLERAFDTARAQAAVVDDNTAEPSDSAATMPPSGERERLAALVRREEGDLARVRQRVRAAAPAQRRALEREALALKNRVELDRARLDFVTKLGSPDSSLSDRGGDLTHQIQALHDAVPELASGASPAPTSAATVEAASSTVGPVRRLLACSVGAGASTISKPPPTISAGASSAIGRP